MFWKLEAPDICDLILVRTVIYFIPPEVHDSNSLNLVRADIPQVTEGKHPPQFPKLQYRSRLGNKVLDRNLVLVTRDHPA